ncbi:MAG TPA: ABC transporter permease [Blastocatellia bacterium]|nr:ABC transporter permease [Blastocatellia bacterium]
MNRLRQDLSYSLRMLIRNPVFTAVAVLTLGLGIGGNTAIFSVVNSVLLRPLPYTDPARLMVLHETKLPQFPEFSVSPGNFLDWQKQADGFEQLAACGNGPSVLSGEGEPERVEGVRATYNLFQTLGIKPLLGRDFRPDEDQPGHDGVVIISNALWHRRFSGGADAVGRHVTLSNQSYTIIGVMPPNFKFPEETDLWVPMAFNAHETASHGAHYISCIGRLKPSTSLKQARIQLDTIAERLDHQYPESNGGWRVKIVPMLEAFVGDIRPILLVLLGAVGLVLLIACANVANLLLARVAAREKELGVRAALGAGRWRLIRQLLTESVVLAFIGGVIGMLLAIAGTRVLLSFAPADLPRVKEIAVDARALGFTFLITMLTAVIFGIVPALQSSKPDLNESLKDSSRGSTGGRHQRVRSALVVIEVAMALVLLVGAGLLIKSFRRLTQVSPGFNPSHALAVTVQIPHTKYPQPQQQSDFFTQLLQKVAMLPGVQSAGAGNVIPFTDDYVLGFNIEGRPPNPPGEDVSTNYYAISPGYFRAMGIPLIKGRLFDEHDTKDSPHVALINQEMAKRFFPNENPIGKRINVTNGPETFREIVGIVGDVKQYGLDQATPVETYEPYVQKPFSFMTVVVRTSIDPSGLADPVRRAVLSIDPDQAVSMSKTLDQIVSESVSKQRFSTLLLSIFAAIALILAAVGIYGVLAYSVAQRTHEIGIRMALGASVFEVQRLVVGNGIILALIGVAIGEAGAIAVTRVMSSFLFNVSATDPATFVIISAVLTGVALVASYVPSRRATRVDPMIALRYE